VRCGIAAGPAIDFRGDLHGLVVPLAARICATAGAEQTYVSEAVRSASRAFEWARGPRAAELKGIPERQDLYEPLDHSR
jgi:class 3 adenylate cyclase